MELQDQKSINADIAIVFAALNDPDILKQCIPGCESLVKSDDTHMAATVVLKVGPVKAKFNGEVELSNLNPPNKYTISGSGKGGAAGHASGGADVELTQDGDITILKYSVKADVGGKIAQLGGRLINSTAKKLAEQFFEKFVTIVESPTETETIVEQDNIKASTVNEEDLGEAALASSKLFNVKNAIYVCVAIILASVLYQVLS